MKKWIINKPDTEKVIHILKKTDLTSLAAEVLVSRGITEIQQLVDFFSQDELSDPFLLKDMYEACEVIHDAIEKELSICIYGDYDCDGITSTAILYNYLQCAGANVSYYIPEREDGYGLNKDSVKKLAQDGIELIITVDNGIVALEEAELIYELGMKLVITDHHQPLDTLPRAEAIVDPHRKDCTSPFKPLAGVGVVIKLVSALDDGNYDFILEQYSDIACIGTIADIVSLTGENRTIVKRGLEQLSVTENAGLTSLMEKSAIKTDNITSTAIAFILAPRINAAGRFGSPKTALKMLVSEDENTEELASELVSLNTKRKKVEDEILKDILNKINQNPSVLTERVIVVDGEDWHHGVVGIVCSRILERFGKPNFIISIEGDEARGSARSVKGFNVFECLSYCSDLLIKSGGHELAGGFSLKKENIPAFKEKIAEYAKFNNPSMPPQVLKADKLLRGIDLKVENVEGLEALEPFGEGNPQPVFAIIGARIDRIVPLANGRHTKLEITYENAKISALLFNTNPDNFTLLSNDYADFIVNVDINEYNNNKNISIKVKDYRRSGIVQDKYFSAKSCYEALKRNESLDEKFIKRIVPSREDLISVYKFLMEYKGKINIDSLFTKLTDDSMNYCKLRLCLDIFSELELIRTDIITENIEFIPPTKKVDLESSQILKELRCL